MQTGIAELHSVKGGNVSPQPSTLDKVAEALGVELVVRFVDLDDPTGDRSAGSRAPDRIAPSREKVGNDRKVGPTQDRWGRTVTPGRSR